MSSFCYVFVLDLEYIYSGYMVDGSDLYLVSISSIYDGLDLVYRFLFGLDTMA